jgi:hypothetical protein
MSLVRLSFELGMAVSDYNCGITHDYNEIIKTTFLYLDKVKDSNLSNEDLVECYAIIGQMWAAVIDRSADETPMALAGAPPTPASFVNTLTSTVPVTPAAAPSTQPTETTTPQLQVNDD